jgi:hypothetical protein
MRNDREIEKEGAREFKEGKWGSVMFLLAVATKEETAVSNRNTFGCQGVLFQRRIKEKIDGETGWRSNS